MFIQSFQKLDQTALAQFLLYLKRSAYLMGTSISVPEDVEVRLRKNGPRKELLASDRANPTKCRLKDNRRTLNFQLPKKNRTNKLCSAEEQLDDEQDQGQYQDERERKITFQIGAKQPKEEILNLKIQEEKQVEELPIDSLIPNNQLSKVITQSHTVVHEKQMSSIIENFNRSQQPQSLVNQQLKPKSIVDSSKNQEQERYNLKETISTCQSFLPSNDKQNNQMASIKSSLKPIKLKKLFEIQQIKPVPKIVRLRLY